jgi:hypothetical protein
MTLPDLQNLTLVQVVSTLLFFAAIDTISAYAIAFANGNFQTAYALDFLRTHVLKVGAPIVLLAVIGTGVPAAGPAAFGVSIGSLIVYIGVTIASIKDSWTDKAVAPTATVNVSPVVEPPASLSKP